VFFRGKPFRDVTTGDTFGASITVTEAHIVQACGMFGDFNPVHSNQQFAEATLFGARVLHGPFTSALMSAPVGMYFEGTAIGYLEHNCRFVKPVYAGDTITSTWTVIETLAKPRHDGGVVRMTGSAVNQENVEVAHAEGSILVANHLPDYTGRIADVARV
jgi:3-hydroxybutyryl-CoA dehydratase